MANRSTFGSVLPRELKRLVDLSSSNPTYEKRVLEPAFNKAGEKIQRYVIRKDYDNELRALFIEAHAHHKKVHTAMLTQKTNIDAAAEEPTETAAA
jgi:hypothetical protein